MTFQVSPLSTPSVYQDAFETYHMDVLVLPNVLNEDLKASFSRHSDEGLLNFKDIGAVLKTTYKGDTPNQKAETMAIASKIASDSVTWEEFIAAVEEVRGMYSHFNLILVFSVADHVNCQPVSFQLPIHTNEKEGSKCSISLHANEEV